MSHNNRNNNQATQATVDVKPEELKPVNNEKPEKVKMTFGEWFFGWPKRHPVATKRACTFAKAVGITVIAGGAAIGGGYVGCTLAHKDMETLDIDDYLDKKALAITAKPPVDDVKPDTADDGSTDTTTFD